MHTKNQRYHTIGLALSKGLIGIGMLLIGVTLTLTAMHVMAAAPSLGGLLQAAGRGLYDGAEAPTPSVGGIVAQVVAVFFGLLGIIFVGFMVYGGFQWMTAAGNPEQVKKAQKLMLDAVIGVAILMAASFISYWVLYTISMKIVVSPVSP